MYLALKATTFGEMTQNKGHYMVQVTTFGTNRKPVCNVPLENNTNLHPTLHYFQDIVEYWSIFLLSTGMALFWGEPLNSGL